MAKRPSFFLFLAVFLTACGGGGSPAAVPDAGGGDAAMSSTTDGSTPADASQASPDAAVDPRPIIESLTANPTTVTPSGTTVSAIVTEPPGASMVAGGTLIDKTTTQTYGAFSTPGGQGTFVYALTWAALNTMSAINLATGATTTRVVTATFFDNESHTRSQDLTLTLSCGDATLAACDGSCFDLATTTKHCGTCGNDCSLLGGGVTCGAGKCKGIPATAAVPPETSCTTVCAAKSLTCDCSSDACGMSVSGGGYVNGFTCTSQPVLTQNQTATLECLCDQM